MASLKVEDSTTPEPLVQEAPDVDDDTFDEEAITSGPTGMKKRTNSKLSFASAAYDVGNKGFLDKEEKILRKYDTDSDGKLDVSEIKNIARDLDTERKMKELFKKIACFTSSALGIMLFAIFGLVVLALNLTKETETQNGSLVDSSTGEMVSTQARGHQVMAKFNEEHGRRLLMLHGRRAVSKIDQDFNFLHEVRRLNEEVPVASLPGMKVADIEQLYHDYQQGADTVVTMTTEEGLELNRHVGEVTYYPEGGLEYNGHIGEVTAYTPPIVNNTGAGDRREQEVVYNDTTYNIVSSSSTQDCFTLEGTEEGTTSPIFRVECCGSEDCVVYQTGTAANCFSPMSTVVEKSKGQMLLKDLEIGDSVLAANGKYQPFVLSPHSSTSERTTFVQIHTTTEGTSKDDDDAPLEATPDHLVFVSGYDLPIPAGHVKVGDKLVGVKGPKTVTKIASVDRDGFYNALTYDATLFVDGVLASSADAGKEKEHINFGPFQVNMHTSAQISAPVMHAVCTKLTSYFCKSQVDDGMGGIMNLWISNGNFIFTLPRVLQAIIYPSLISLGVMALLSYYAIIFGVTSLVVLGGFILIIELVKKKKAKLA